MLFRSSTYIFVLFLTLLCNVGLANDGAVKKPFSTSYHTFSVVSNLIVVQAEMNGQVGNYVFDTGASGLVLNADNHSGIGKACDIQGVSNDVTEAYQTTVPKFRFGNVVKRNWTAACMPLDHIEAMLGIELAGLIGMDLLLESSIYIDYDANLITLTDPSLMNQPDHTMVITFINNVPTIEVSIENRTARMAIDFGASTSLLDQAIAKQLDLDLIEQVDLQTSSGTTDRLDKVSIKGIKLDNSFSFDTEAVVVDLSHIQFKETKIDGLIGLDLLKSRKVMLCPSKNKLMLWE